MRYHRKAAEPVVVGRTKVSLPVFEENAEVVTPLQASLVAVDEMMAASRARRKAELKKTHRAREQALYDPLLR